MFKDGEKIVCIDNSNGDRRWDLHNPFEHNPLKLYMIYEVKRIIYGEHDFNNQVVIEMYGTTLVSFNVKRFISLTEFRRIKLDKIKSKIR